MTTSKIRWKMNLKVQLWWWLFYILLGVLAAALLIIGLSFLIEEMNIWVKVFLGVIVCAGVAHYFGKDIIIEETKVPPGCVGVPTYQGKITGELLEPVTAPIVTSLPIPIVGIQEMYDIYSVPDQTRVPTMTVEVSKVTTRNVGKIPGLEVVIPLSVQYEIFDPIRFVENLLANTTHTGDTSFDGNLKAILKTILKEVLDRFTFDELDESKRSSRDEDNIYKGKLFRDAILLELKMGHGGLTCTECGPGDLYVKIDEWGVIIRQILPESNMSADSDYNKARAEGAIASVKMEGGLQNTETAMKMAKNLREGLDATGKKRLFPKGKEDRNPFHKMSDTELKEVVQIIMGDREKPQNFNITTSGSGGGSGGASSDLMQVLMAKLISEEFELKPKGTSKK